MGYAHADKLIGIHVNFLAVRREPERIKNPTPEEQVFIDQVKSWLKEDAAYASIQGTRPQTLSFGLTDSPAGLAAWIVEKFRAWSDCGGDVESVFTRDQMLANISFYWFTGAIGSSFYPYYFRSHRPWMIPDGPRSRRRRPTPSFRAKCCIRRARWPSRCPRIFAAGR